MGDITPGAASAYSRVLDNGGRQKLEVDFTRITTRDPLARRKAESIETQSTEAGFLTGLTQKSYGEPAGFLDMVLPFQDDGADELAGSMDRISMGSATGADYERVRRYHDLASRPKNQWYQAGAIARESIPFALEWYVSSKTLGVLGGLSQGIRGARAAKRMATVGRGLESLDTPFLTATQRVNQMLARGQNVRGGLLKAAIETPKQYATQTVLGEVFGDSRLRSYMYNDYMMNRFDVVQDNDYGLSVRIADDAYGLWANSLPRALVDGLIETFSESMGHALVHMVPSLKMALTGSGFRQSGTASRMLAFLGLSGDTRYAGAWSKFGFSGLVPEMGEEFIGAGLRDVVHQIAPELADPGNTEHLLDNIVPIMTGMAMGMFAPAAVSASFNVVDTAIDYQMLSPARRKRLAELAEPLKQRVQGFAGVVAIGNMLEAGARAAGSMHAAATPELRQQFFNSKNAQKMAADRLRERSQDPEFTPTREEVGHEMRAMWEETMRLPILDTDGKSAALDELVTQGILTEEQRDKYLAEAARRFAELRDAVKRGDLQEFLANVADMAIDSNAAEAAFDGAAAELQPEAMAAAGQRRGTNWVAMAQNAAKDKGSLASPQVQKYLRAVSLRGIGDVQTAVEQARRVGKQTRKLQRIQAAIQTRVSQLGRAMGWKNVRADLVRPPKHGPIGRLRNLGVQVIVVTGDTGGKIAWWDGELQMLFVNEAALEAEAKRKGISADAQAARTALHELIHVHVQRMGKSAVQWLRQMDAWLTEAVGKSQIARDKYEDEVEWLEESVADRIEAFANVPNPDAGKRGILRRMAGWVLDELLSWVAPRALLRRRMMRLVDGLNDAGIATRGASRGQIAMRMATFDLARQILTMRVSDETLKVELQQATRTAKGRKRVRRERKEEEPTGPDWWTEEAGFKVQLAVGDELEDLLALEQVAESQGTDMPADAKERLRQHRMSQLALWRRQQAESPGELETPELAAKRGEPTFEYDDLEPIQADTEDAEVDQFRQVVIDELEAMDFEQLYDRLLEAYGEEPEDLRMLDPDLNVEGRNYAMRLAILHLEGIETLSADTLAQVEQVLGIDLAGEDFVPGIDYDPTQAARRKAAESAREKEQQAEEDRRKEARENEERRAKRREREREQRLEVIDDLKAEDPADLSDPIVVRRLKPLVEDLLNDPYLKDNAETEILREALLGEASTVAEAETDITDIIVLAELLQFSQEQPAMDDPLELQQIDRLLRKIDRILKAFNEESLPDLAAELRRKSAPPPVTAEQMEAAAEALKTGASTSVSTEEEPTEEADPAPVRPQVTAADVRNPFAQDADPAKFAAWIMGKDPATDGMGRAQLAARVERGDFDNAVLEITVPFGAAGAWTYLHSFAEYVKLVRGAGAMPTVVVTVAKKNQPKLRFQSSTGGPQMPESVRALLGLTEEQPDVVSRPVAPLSEREGDLWRLLVWSDAAIRHRFGVGWVHEERVIGTARSDAELDAYLRSQRGTIVELERPAPGSEAPKTHDMEVDRYYQEPEYAYIEQDGTQRIVPVEQLRVPGAYYMPLSAEYTLDDIKGKTVLFKQAIGVKDFVPIRSGVIVSYRPSDDSFLVNIDGKREYISARNIYDPRYSYRVEGLLPLYDVNGDMILETVVDPDEVLAEYQELRERAQEEGRTEPLTDDEASAVQLTAQQFLQLRGEMATLRLVPMEGNGPAIEVSVSDLNPERQDMSLQYAVARALAQTGYQAFEQEAQQGRQEEEDLPKDPAGVRKTVEAAAREADRQARRKRGAQRGGRLRRKPKAPEVLLDTLEGAGQKGLAFEMLAEIIAADVRVARALVTFRTVEDADGRKVQRVFVNAKRARALRKLEAQGVSLSPYERQLLEADAQGQITDVLEPIAQDLSDLLNGRITPDALAARLESLRRRIKRDTKAGREIPEHRISRAASLTLLVDTYEGIAGRRADMAIGVGRESTTNVQEEDGGLRSQEEVAAEEGNVAAVREAEDAIKKKGQPRIEGEGFGSKLSRRAMKELLGELVSRAMGFARKPQLIEELVGDKGEAGQIQEWWKRWQLQSIQLQDQRSWAALQAMSMLTPRGKALSDDALASRDPRGDQDHVSSPLVRMAAMLQWAAVGPTESTGKKERVVGIPLGVMSTAPALELLHSINVPTQLGVLAEDIAAINGIEREAAWEVIDEIAQSLAQEQYQTTQRLLTEFLGESTGSAFAAWRKKYRRDLTVAVALEQERRQTEGRGKQEEVLAQKRQSALRALRNVKGLDNPVAAQLIDLANLMTSAELVLGQMQIEQELLSQARRRDPENTAQGILAAGSLEAAAILQEQIDDMNQVVSSLRDGYVGDALVLLRQGHENSRVRLRYAARKVVQAGYIANARYLQRDLRKSMLEGGDVMITSRGVTPITYVLNPMVVYSPDVKGERSTDRTREDMLALTGGGSPVALLRMALLDNLESGLAQHFNLYEELTVAYENGQFEKQLEELRKSKDPGVLSVLDSVAELVLQQVNFTPSQAVEYAAYDVSQAVREFYKAEVFEEGNDIVVRGAELPGGKYRELRISRGEAIVDGNRTRIYKMVPNDVLAADAPHYHQMVYRVMGALKTMESRRAHQLGIDERYAYGFDITGMTDAQQYTVGVLNPGVKVREGEYVTYGTGLSQQFTMLDGPTARPHQPDSLLEEIRQRIKDKALDTDVPLFAAMEIAESKGRLLEFLKENRANARVQSLLEELDPQTFRVRFQTSRDGLDEFGQPPTEAARKAGQDLTNVWSPEELPQGTDGGWSSALFLKTYDNWLRQTNWYEHLAGRQWRLNRERLQEFVDDTNKQYGDYDELDAALQMWVDITGWLTPGGQRLMYKLIPKKERHRALPKTFDEMWEYFQTRRGSKLNDQHRRVFEIARRIELNPELTAVRQLGNDIALQARQNTQIALQARLIEAGQTFYTSLAWVTNEGQEVVQNPSEYGFAEATGAGGPFRQGVGYRALRRQLVGTLEGFSHGLRLRNMSAINTQYRTMRTINEARHNRALLISLERTGILKAKVGAKNTPGMRDLKNIHMQGYEATEWMAKYLNNAMTQANLRDIENKYFRRYMKATIAAKHMMLSFGFFHHQAFLRSYLYTVRSEDAQRALMSDTSLVGIGLASLMSYARAFGQTSEKALHNRAMGFEPYAVGRRAWEEQSPDLKMLIEENLTVQVGGEVTNKMGGAFYTLEDQDDMDEWMRKAAERIQKMGMPASATQAAMNLLNGVRKAQRETAFWLFNSMGANLKAAAALSEFKELKAKYADRIRPDKDPDQTFVRMIAREAAEKVNADFGGLNMRARTGKVDDLFGKGGPRSARAQMILRGLLLAPDWTESNLYTLLASFKRGNSYATPREINDMRLNMYRTMWLRVGTRAMMLQMLGMMLMAGLDDDDDMWDLYCQAGFPGCADDAAPHWSKFRWLDVNVSALSPSQSRKFLSTLGHFGDPIKWTTDLIKDGPFAPVDRKGSVALRSIVEFITGADYSGRRFTTLSELLGVDQPGVYQRRTRLPSGEIRYPGESRGGKYRGQLSRFSVKTGPLRLDQATSYMLTQGLKFVPLQARGLAEYLTGAKDGFDLTAELLGAKYGRTYVKE